MNSHPPPQPTRAEPADPTLGGEELYAHWRPLGSAFWTELTDIERMAWNVAADWHTREVRRNAADLIDEYADRAQPPVTRYTVKLVAQMLRDIA